jgi:predicted transcriptional regulator
VTTTKNKDSARRGRPRPQGTIDRDEQVLQLLQKGPLTRTEIAEKLGIESGAAYLSLFRLHKTGRVAKVAKGEGTGNSWEAVPAKK